MSTVDDPVSVGDPTPDFTLKDAEGRDWHLADHFGRTIELLFYPGDETPVCAKQLCSVGGNWEQYRATGGKVVGIATDSAESHRKFAENHELPLTLLSDPRGEVSRRFGAKSWLPGRAARAVVVIDRRGIVRYRKVQPRSIFRPRDEEIIEAIRAAEVASP